MLINPISTSNRNDSGGEGEEEILMREEDVFLEQDGEIEPAVGVSDDDDELMILCPLTDEFDEKVAEAQEKLLHLRHQQEQLEKQKAELEELKRKRAKFVRGRAEATDRLTKATTMLEREMFEGKKRLEQFGHTREAFERHLKVLESINPEDWAREEVRTELSRALAAIQDARDEYTTEMARVGVLLDAPVELPTAPLPVEVLDESLVEVSKEGVRGGSESLVKPAVEVRDFMYWLKSGFAFTLPLLVFGIFALVLLLVIL